MNYGFHRNILNLMKTGKEFEALYKAVQKM